MTDCVLFKIESFNSPLEGALGFVIFLKLVRRGTPVQKETAFIKVCELFRTNQKHPTVLDILFFA